MNSKQDDDSKYNPMPDILEGLVEYLTGEKFPYVDEHEVTRRLELKHGFANVLQWHCRDNLNKPSDHALPEIANRSIACILRQDRRPFECPCGCGHKLNPAEAVIALHLRPFIRYILQTN